MPGQKDSDMTRNEALREARRRWGLLAGVLSNRDRHGLHCRVGMNFRSCSPLVLGVGDSWEAAFEKADQRALRQELIDAADEWERTAVGTERFKPLIIAVQKVRRLLKAGS